MPLYDYQCEKCGVNFEHEHAMSFTGKVKCPACGSVRTTKVFSPAGVHFKGSGFYVTDSSNSRNAVTTAGKTDITPADKPECETCPANTKNKKKDTKSAKKSTTKTKKKS